MNEILPERFIERVERLAIGVTPLDWGRQGLVGHPITLAFDDAVLGRRRPNVERHDSCRYALRYQPDVSGGEQVVIRLTDDSERLVPRRLRIPLPTVAEAEDLGMEGPAAMIGRRLRRPVLFPGAAYNVPASAMTIRGRVVRDSGPMRWARVTARVPMGPVVGRAHGDDQGEFLLLLRPQAAGPGELGDLLEIEVTVTGPETPPEPDSPEIPARDRFWDLPIEQAAPPGAEDSVLAGETLPADYGPPAQVARPVSLRYGRPHNEIEPFVIPN